MTILYILLGIVAVIIGWLIATYNGLVRLRQQAKEAESDIGASGQK